MNRLHRLSILPLALTLTLATDSPAQQLLAPPPKTTPTLPPVPPTPLPGSLPPPVPETEKPAVLPVPPGMRKRTTPDDDFKPIPLGPVPELPPMKPQSTAPHPALKIGAVSVEFRGLSMGVKEEVLLALVQTRPGRPYSDEQAKKDVQKLEESGLVTHVQTDIEMMENEKLHLNFVVSSRARVADLEIRGSSVFTPEVLLQQIVLKNGSATNGDQVMEEARKLLKFHHNDYYTDAVVTATAEPAREPGFYKLTYTIKEGGRNFIKQVRFEGNAHFSSSTLKEVLKPMDTITQEDTTLMENVRRLERWYQDQGHVYAKVTEVRRQPLSDQEIEIIYQISEGARYHISKVTISGDKHFQSDVLESCLQIKPGQMYNRSLLVRSEKMLADYHGARGYAHARVETSVVETAAAEVSLSFAIMAREVCRVGKINVAGNSVTAEAVILRGLGLASGDLVNAVLVDEHRARLEKLDYFSAVDVRLALTNTPQEYDIDITVSEKATDLLTFMGGYSSLGGPWLSLLQTQRNFSTSRHCSYRGDGIDMRLELKVGGKDNSMNLKVATKDFFGRPLQLKLPTVGPAPAAAHTP